MRPSDRTIRDELRREAARVTIPGDMWDNIKQRLDGEHEAAERRKRLANGRAQWKPAMVFAAAAGIFWMTVIPLSKYMDGVPVSEPLSPPSARSFVEPDLSRSRPVPAEADRRIASTTAQSGSGQQVERVVNTHSTFNVPTRY